MTDEQMVTHGAKADFRATADLARMEAGGSVG
jgi:hypothetical protein